MIKRHISKKLIPVENLIEDTVTGTGGIDVTSPPNKLSTAYDMENLSVCLDGGLSLRKPLLYNTSLNNVGTQVIVDYTFDDKRIEVSLTDIKTITFVNIDNPNDTKTVSYFEDINDSTDRIDATKVAYGDSYILHIDDPNCGNLPIVNDRGEEIPVSLISINDYNLVKIINTNTSTIILGLYFNMYDEKLSHYAKKYNITDGNYIKPRPVRITKEGSTYKAEVMQIETATLYTSSSGVSKVDFNLMDDYVYSFRDNYNAGYAYAMGINAYTPNETYTDLSSYSVEELTESDKFTLVDSITKDDFDKKYILKAFVTNSTIPMKGYKTYCTWEKTYDNITWANVEEFVDNAPSDAISLDITDSSKSYESLDDKYTYTRRVLYVPFLNENASQFDSIGSRPDVLILNEIDGATYRFTIRSIADIDTETVKIARSPGIYVTGPTLTQVNYQNVITVDSLGSATIDVNLVASFKGNVVSDLTGKVFAAIRSPFDNTGLDNSYKKSFNTSLTDSELDGRCNPAQALTVTYNPATDTTDINETYTIPLTLNSGWLAQQMCFQITVFVTSTSESLVIGSPIYTAIVGRDFTNNVYVSNPEFKYALEPQVWSYGTVNIHSNDSSHPDCYRAKINNLTGEGYLEYISDRDISKNISLNLNIYEVVGVKNSLSIEMLNNLLHSNDTYIFNNFKYMFKNISFRIRVHLYTTAWSQGTSIGIWKGVTAYDAFLDIRVYADMVMTLEELLKIKINRVPISNALRKAAYTYEINLSRDTEYIREENPEQIVSSFINDVCDRLQTNDIPVSDNLTVTLYGMPFTTNDSGVQVNLNNVNITTYSGNVFRVENSNWVYGNVNDYVNISDLDFEITPESYSKMDLFIKTSYPKYPFKYLYWDGGLLKSSENLNAYNLYKTLVSNNPTVVYNLNKEVRAINPEIPQYDPSFSYATRYSLELVSSQYVMLVTKNKQIDNYTNLSLYDSNKIYYKYRIWHFGGSLKNNIYFSNVDSIITPIDNCLTLNTDTDDTVTSLVPWRDYLIATTENSIYLISVKEDSYGFKQINTFIGVPDADALTCKAILNGIIFKSGNAIYTLHPNTYSSDDTILNITDISKPISHHLIKGTNNFAIATEYYYYVFIPRTTDTLVFKYEYIRRIWNKFTYPIVLTKAKLFNVGDILVTDTNHNVYDFDKDLDWYKDKLNVDYLEYGDYLDDTQTSTAINFYLDTGQKSSNIQLTKQFTESKLIASVLDEKAIFPMNVNIYVDGINLAASKDWLLKCIEPITMDASTDGAFRKESSNSVGYLNTNIPSNLSEDLNTIRQMILRFMAKGKSIRFVIKGESTFNFKIYMLYYRYRIPHNKQ